LGEGKVGKAGRRKGRRESRREEGKEGQYNHEVVAAMFRS